MNAWFLYTLKILRCRHGHSKGPRYFVHAPTWLELARTVYRTVYYRILISLPKILHIHRTYMVLVNPTHDVFQSLAHFCERIHTNTLTYTIKHTSTHVPHAQTPTGGGVHTSPLAPPPCICLRTRLSTSTASWTSQRQYQCLCTLVSRRGRCYSILCSALSNVLRQAGQRLLIQTLVNWTNRVNSLLHLTCTL